MAIWVVRRNGVEEEDVASDEIVGNVADVRMQCEEDDIESNLESSLQLALREISVKNGSRRREEFAAQRLPDAEYHVEHVGREYQRGGNQDHR